MIQLKTIKFLKDLEKNNNRPWFELNRSVYEAAKADLQNVVAELIPAIGKFDEPIGNLVSCQVYYVC